MDGLPGLSFPGIAPGETFTYRFKVRQSGTYWYHSHSGMQEQTGVYGAIVYVNEQGRTAFRLELEYDILLTQKLVLQPRIETNFYSRRDPSRDVSSGLSNIEAGLRLRYEFRREFAPYVGIEWASRFGTAADAIRASGKDPEEMRLVAGVHFWF